MGVTLALLALLGVIFLKGFREAIGIATFLVAIYLGLNVVVTFVALWEVIVQPHLIPAWKTALFAQHGGSIPAMVGLSLVLFPKLALGLSGFETGVAVMPLIEAEDEKGRIENTHKLLK